MRPSIDEQKDPRDRAPVGRFWGGIWHIDIGKDEIDGDAALVVIPNCLLALEPRNAGRPLRS